MQQEHQLTVAYDRDILVRANRRFLLRSFGWLNFAFLALLVAGFVYLLATGHRGWETGSLGAAVLLLLALIVAVFRAYEGRSLERLAQMTSKTVGIGLSEEGISVRSDLGAAEVPWSQFIALWRDPDLWLLFHAKNAFITLPVGDLAPDAMLFIERKVRDVGGKLR